MIKKALFVVVFFIGVGILIGYLITKVLSMNRHPVQTQTVSIAKNPIVSVTKRNNSGLARVIEQALLGTKGIYGIAIKNVKTEDTYFLKEDRVFEPGSLYKLWIMAVVYQQIESGKLKKTDVLKQKVEVLNEKFNIASDSAELTEGEIELTVSDALEKMISVSDNYAALLLSEKVRLLTVKTFLEKNDFALSKVGNLVDSPRTTPYETMQFFEKLYAGNFANETYTLEMIELLERQRLNNKLPKYLPENILIAHKTGELGTVTHDAGIIYAPSGEYFISVFSESNDRAGAEERIAQISKAVYFYFNTEGGEAL